MKSEISKNFDLFVNELIYLVQYEDNHYAFQLLKNHMQGWFSAVTWRNIKKFPNIALNFNHLNAYWSISILKSVYIYNSWLEVPFCQFSIQQYNWFLLSYLRTFIHRNYIPFNYSTVYDENDFHNNYEVYKNGFFYKNNFNYDNELQLLIQVNKNKLNTTLEKTVFEMKIQGYSNKEIANLKKYDYRTVDNTWQRIKKKYLNLKN